VNVLRVVERILEIGVLVGLAAAVIGGALGGR
jgi:hypothetical protein